VPLSAEESGWRWVRHHALVSLAIALAALLGACGLFDDPREKAAFHLANGNLAAARIEATNAIQKNEADGEAYLLLGQVLFAQRDLVGAERVLGKAAALEIDPNRVDGMRARALLQMRAYAKIIEEIKPTPAHRSEVRALMLAARGQAQLAMRKRDEARASFQAALAAMPGLPDALLGQAQLAYIERKPEEALALIERIVVKTPKYAAAWEIKAALLQLQGKTDEAIHAFEQAAAVDPADVTPTLAAAELSLQIKRFDAAQRHIDAARKHAPDSLLVHHVQALLYFEQKQYDKALVATQEILRANPKIVPTVMLAATTHIARGELNQAENFLRPLVQARPQDLRARTLYAATLLRMGNARGALDSLAPALGKMHDDPRLLILAAEIHAGLKDYTTATTYFERAAKLQPDRVDLLARAGLARFVGGDEVQGLATLEKAIALSGENYGADVALAVLLLERREFQKALGTAQRIQTKVPDNPIGFNLAGMAQLGLKNMAAARNSFEHAVRLDPGYWPAAASLVRMDIAAGHEDAARNRIERVLAKNGNNVEAMLALMQISGDLGRFTRSLQAACRADPKALTPRLTLARTYLGQGLPERALPLAREVVAIAPQRPDAMELLGAVQLAAGRNSEALTTFRQLASALPKSSRAQAHLAHAQAALGDSNGAESAYRKALALGPEDAEAIVGLARLYGQRNRFGEALQLAADLRAAQPKAAAGHVLAGDLYSDAKRYPDAIKAYEVAFALVPSGDLVVKLHAARLAAGEKPGDAMLTQWLTKHPHDFLVRMHLANQRYFAGQYRDAIGHYQTIVKADPNHAFALNNLASAYLKINDARALAMAEAASALKPDDASVLDTLGVAQTRYGKPEDAVDTLRKAIARQPDSSAVRVNYALALARNGERAAARTELQKLIDSDEAVILEPEAKALLGMP
jgi:putative PEP-CTERM system TPR-repeat lipoprotein